MNLESTRFASVVSGLVYDRPASSHRCGLVYDCYAIHCRGLVIDCYAPLPCGLVYDRSSLLSSPSKALKRALLCPYKLPSSFSTIRCGIG